MDLIEFELCYSDEIEDEKPETCKGWYYRGRSSSYVSPMGEVRNVQTLKKLKRRSCKGCENCYWIEEHISEFPEEVIVPDEIEDGALYVMDVHITKNNSYWEEDYEIQISYDKINEDVENEG